MTTASVPSLAVEDRLAIHDLIAAYSWRCDTKAFDQVAQLFAEDGVWDEQVLGAPRCEGRQAVHDMFTMLAQADIPYVVHTICNERLESGDGALASGTCHVHAQGSVNGKPLDVLGYYDDRYVKVEGEWLFASRTLVAFVPPNPVM